VEKSGKAGMRGVRGYLFSGVVSVADAAGRGATGRHWPEWVVASSAGAMRARRGRFWTDAGGRGCRDGRAYRSVTSARAGGRRWPWRSNGREGVSVCASRVLRRCRACVRERNRPRAGVG
jgi:hypothetical protein